MKEKWLTRTVYGSPRMGTTCEKRGPSTGTPFQMGLDR